jgi:ABC-type multidrug transport system ATPase subunit
MNPFVKAESLLKRFGNVIAVDNISFEISRGEIFGFLGPNRTGKTTTIKMMSGLLKPDRGEITIDTRKGRGAIGKCPQNVFVG